MAGKANPRMPSTGTSLWALRVALLRCAPGPPFVRPPRRPCPPRTRSSLTAEHAGGSRQRTEGGIRRSPPKVWLKTEKGPMWKSSTAWTEGPKGRRANGAPALASGPVMRPVPNSICRVPPVHTSHQLPTCGSLRSPAWARSIRPGQPEKCHVVTGVTCTPSTLAHGARETREFQRPKRPIIAAPIGIGAGPFGASAVCADLACASRRLLTGPEAQD